MWRGSARGLTVLFSIDAFTGVTIASVKAVFLSESTVLVKIFGETAEKVRGMMACSFHRQVCRGRVSAVQ